MQDTTGFERTQKLKFIQTISDQNNLLNNAYLHALLAFLAKGDKLSTDKNAGEEFLNAPEILFFDKLAFLFRFYPLNQLIVKLNILVEQGIKEGKIEVLALIGLKNKRVPQLLQNFVDKSSDLQTAAYAASFV